VWIWRFVRRILRWFGEVWRRDDDDDNDNDNGLVLDEAGVR
jgi:hypothetical protein